MELSFLRYRRVVDNDPLYTHQLRGIQCGQFLGLPIVKRSVFAVEGLFFCALGTTKEQAIDHAEWFLRQNEPQANRMRQSL